MAQSWPFVTACLAWTVCYVRLTMKIFISWSGPFSQHAAQCLREWLPYIFQDIEPFVSTEDIKKGSRWRLELATQLATTHFGIVCLSSGHTDTPWLMFEAGALSKSLEATAAVSTLLFGVLKSSDIKGPLADFQHTNFEKEDFYRLVKRINEVQPSKRPEGTLRTVFDKFWGDLEKMVHTEMPLDQYPVKERDQEDMIREILDIVRQIPKREPCIKPTTALEYSDAELLEFLANNDERKADCSLRILSPQMPITLQRKLIALGIDTVGKLTTQTISTLENWGLSPNHIKIVQGALAVWDQHLSDEPQQPSTNNENIR
jgi:hypothetical protein